VRPQRASIAFALLCAALAFAWQSLTVHYNFSGNWTALFCTGSSVSIPPPLAEESIYTFSNSDGYDGQFYHFIAHDPFMQRGFQGFMDAPGLRYRRILVPGLAYLLAGGRDEYVHAALYLVLLASVFLGAYWLSRYAFSSRAHPAWGLGFLLMPATIISIDRFTVDLTLMALCAGFALCAKEGPSWKLYTVLVLAALTRETGYLLAGGYCVFLLCRRDWLRAAWYATAVGPALAWYLFVHFNTLLLPSGIHTRYVRSHHLGEVLLHQFMNPVSYALPPVIAWTATVLDYLALFGALLALFLAVRVTVRRTAGPMEISGFLFVVLVFALAPMVGFTELYGYPRTLSPLFLFLALRGLPAGSWISALPIFMVLPRLGLQLVPQMLGVLGGLAGLSPF
jgi:hypothetical protein